MAYDAFISYSHTADGQLAPAVQTGLQRLARPWYRRRALRIFRDETGLSVNPHLWNSIVAAMDQAEWFVLLASPNAAASPWVDREIKHWLATKPAERLLPVLTEGEWHWDERTRDLDADRSTAVPPALLGVFTEEPRHLDLRWARDETHLDLRHSRFRGQMADIAAPIHGIAKDELEGEDIRQHRRALRWAWGAGIALLLLSAAAVSAALLARVQYDRTRDATSRAEQSAVEARLAQTRAEQSGVAAVAEKRRAIGSAVAAEAARARAVRSERLALVAQAGAEQSAAEAFRDQQRAERALQAEKVARADQQKALKQADDALAQARDARDKATRASDEAQRNALLASANAAEAKASAILAGQRRDEATLLSRGLQIQNVRLNRANAQIRSSNAQISSSALAAGSLNALEAGQVDLALLEAAQSVLQGKTAATALTATNPQALAAIRRVVHTYPHLAAVVPADLAPAFADEDAALSPDGRIAVMASHLDGVTAWDVGTGRRIGNVPAAAFPFYASSASIAVTDAGVFAEATFDGSLRISDLSASSVRATVDLAKLLSNPADVPLTASAVAFSPDGKRLVLLAPGIGGGAPPPPPGVNGPAVLPPPGPGGDQPTRLVVFDLSHPAHPSVLAQIDLDPEPSVAQVAVDSAGTVAWVTAAAGPAPATLTVRSRGAATARFTVDLDLSADLGPDTPTRLGFSSTGSQVELACACPTVRRTWDARTGAQQSALAMPAASTVLDISPHVSTIAVFDAAHNVTVRRLSDGSIVGSPIPAAEATRATRVTDKGVILAPLSDSARTLVLDPSKGGAQRSLGPSLPSGSLPVLSPGGELVAAWTAQGVRIWRSGGGLIDAQPPAGTGDGCGARLLRFSPDGTLLAWTDNTGVLVWNIGQGSMARRIPVPFCDVKDVAIDAGATRIAVVTNNGLVSLGEYSLSSGTSLIRRPGAEGMFSHVLYGRTGITLAAESADPDSSITVWRRDGTRRNISKGGRPLFFGPGDTALYVAVANDSTLVRWDLTPTRPVGSVRGTALAVAAVSEDGRLAVVTTPTGVRLLNTDTGATVVTLQAGIDPITSVTFTRGGGDVRAAIAGQAGRRGQVLEWQLDARPLVTAACAIVQRDFTDKEWAKLVGGTKQKTC